MSDKKDTPADAAPKKKGKMGKIVIGAVALIVLVGGGVGAGVYASGAGLLGGHKAGPVDDGKPKLVPKSEQKAPAEGEGGGHGGEEAAPANHGKPTPEGQGGDQYASTYYSMDKDFTSNLQGSAHFIQIGVAVSTPYDDTVIEHLKTNEIAVRSAILTTLGDTTEDQVFTANGKQQLQARLVKTINATLQQKEGFGGVSNVYFTSFVVQ